MQPITNLLIGTGVLYMALFTPFALFRLFAFVDPSTDAGASFREWMRGLGVNSYGDPLAGQGNPAARFEANQLGSALPGLANAFPGLRSGTRGHARGAAFGSGEEVEDVHEQRFDEQSATNASGPKPGTRPGGQATASPSAEQVGTVAADAATETAAAGTGVPVEAVEPVVDASASAAGSASDTGGGSPGAANRGRVVANSIDDFDSGARQRAARATAADSDASSPTVQPPGSESDASGAPEVNPDVAGADPPGTGGEVDPPGSDVQPRESDVQPGESS